MRPTWMQHTILVQDFNEKSGQKKDQKISQKHFPKLPQVEQLINIYENNRNCDKLPESFQRAPRELPLSSHLQALVKYVSW